MTLVGTVIYGNQGELSILLGLGTSDSVMDAILKGGQRRFIVVTMSRNA